MAYIYLAAACLFDVHETQGWDWSFSKGNDGQDLVCHYALAMAQNNHHPPNHHPHPDGQIHCGQTSDCPPCDANNTAVCNNNHVCECVASTGKRAVCHNGNQCACPSGQSGVCNSQGHCECGDHGKRAVCHNGNQCTCPSGQSGVCNSQGHCECGDHGKRAVCHNGHQCSCPSGQNGVCNEQGHCECGDHAVGKRAGETCDSVQDCANLTCDQGGTPTCEKHNDQPGHCHCKH